MMGSVGRWTSVMLPTRTLSTRARNPKVSATDDSPSTIATAPFSTRAGQSAADGPPGRRTNMPASGAGASRNPTLPRICGQAPGDAATTAKEAGRPALGEAASADNEINKLTKILKPDS